MWLRAKIPKLEANKVTTRKQASSGAELTHQPTLANWPCWERVCSLIWVQHQPHTDFKTEATIFDRQITAICRRSNLRRGSWCGMAWLEGTVLWVPLGFGWHWGSFMPVLPRRAGAGLGGKVRWPWWGPRPVAGRFWADKLHQGCLAWLQPWPREIQAGAGDVWGREVVAEVRERLRARRQQEGAGQGVKAEVVAMEPEFKKWDPGGLSEQRTPIG